MVGAGLSWLGIVYDLVHFLSFRSCTDSAQMKSSDAQSKGNFAMISVAVSSGVVVVLSGTLARAPAS